jgi:Sec-independent protein translocase protein TatA
VFGISMYELGLIALIGLIFLGPRQLTETARAVGRMVRELQKMATDVQRTINLDLDGPPTTSSSSYNYNREPTTPEPTSKTTDEPDKDLKLPVGEKAGPDFYAELLASSSEPEKTTSKDDEKIETSPDQEKPKQEVS